MEPLYIKDYHTLPRQFTSSKIYASPGSAPLIEPALSPTMKSHMPVTSEPPHYSEVFCQNEAKEKLRLALHSLLLVCCMSVFFTFVSLNRLDALERKAFNLTHRHRNEVTHVVWEMSISVTLVTVLGSLATFFISSLQLFFALKMAKANLAVPEVALRYLQDGRLVRLPTLFVFFLLGLSFLLSVLVSLVFLPAAFSAVSRGVACLMGVFLLVFCSFASLHSAHSVLRLDLDFNDSTAKSANNYRTALARDPRYSTLV